MGCILWWFWRKFAALWRYRWQSLPGLIRAPHGPLTRYAKLRVPHAPGMPGAFSPPPRVSDPDMHLGTCRDACRDRWTAVSFKVGRRENVPGMPGACANRNLPYLVRGPWQPLQSVREYHTCGKMFVTHRVPLWCHSSWWTLVQLRLVTCWMSMYYLSQRRLFFVNWAHRN